MALQDLKKIYVEHYNYVIRFYEHINSLEPDRVIHTVLHCSDRYRGRLKPHRDLIEENHVR